MRIFCLCSFLMLVVSCQKKKEADPQPAPDGPVNGEPVAPASEVVGAIHGKAFKPDKIEFERGKLTFRSGKDFFADMEIWFQLPLTDNPKLEGKEFKYSREQVGPSIFVGVKEGDNLPKTEFVFPNDYTMTLKITKHTAKTLEANIDLRFVKPANSHLSGNFTATITKAAADPPDAEDAPYIHGKIVVPGPLKDESFGAGFFGKGTDGKNVSNMAGTNFTTGGGGSITSTSFKPQLTSIFLHPTDGLRFKHVRVPPGEHVVYARRGEVLAAWKKVTVKAGDELTVDLPIDPAQFGSLVITLPDAEANDKNESPLALVPLEFDSFDYSLRYAFKAADVKSGNKTVAVKGVPAGKYKAVRGNSEAAVEVTAGKESAATLVRKGKGK